MKGTGKSMTRVGLGAAFMLAGLLIISVGTGVMPVDPVTMRAPAWIIVLCGAVLVLSGLTALAELVASAFIDPLAILFVVSFAIVAGWVALGSGDGSFYGSVSLGPSQSLGARELTSRIVFGFGTIILLVVAGGIAARSIRQSRADDLRDALR